MQSKVNSGPCSSGAQNWADWEATKRSYELYARYVMPHFSGVNRHREESYGWVSDHTAEFSELRSSAAQQMIA